LGLNLIEPGFVGLLRRKEASAPGPCNGPNFFFLLLLSHSLCYLSLRSNLALLLQSNRGSAVGDRACNCMQQKQSPNYWWVSDMGLQRLDESKVKAIRIVQFFFNLHSFSILYCF